jgi:RNA polymerase sigma factor (sigma-70 family)
MLVKRSSMLPGNGRSVSELSEMSVRELAELSTPELVALAQSGEREAFGELFRRYGRRVLMYAVRKCDGTPAVADDVAAEVWVKALTRIGAWENRGRDDDDFLRWLFGLVRGGVGEARVARWTEVPALVSSTALDEMDQWLADASSEFDDLDECPAKAEMIARLRTEIDRLSPACRSVVRLRLNGAGLDEITGETGLTAKQVSDAWRRAQVQLRQRLVGRLDVESLSDAERAELRELAQELPDISREVALLRLDGLSVPQIAQKTGMTRGQAHNAWRHAEDLLRKLQDDPKVARRAKHGREAVWQKERDRLRVAAQALGSATRRVALLRLDGVSHRQIAEQLGCPVGTVASAWRYALDSFTRAGHLPLAA